MDGKPRSLGACIDEFARVRDARPRFVEQVRELFRSKGISLDSDGTPYRSTLEEVFEREETTTRRTRAARAKLTDLQRNLDEMRDGYARLALRLRELRVKADPSARLQGVFRLNRSATARMDCTAETRSSAQSIEHRTGGFQYTRLPGTLPC